jgi:hypothetical protein
VERQVIALVDEVVGPVGHAAHIEAHLDLRVVARERGDRVGQIEASDPLR